MWKVREGGVSEAGSRIEHMSDLEKLDSGATLARLAESVRAQAAAEAEQVAALAHLADLHGPLSPDQASSDLFSLVMGERYLHIGADGTAPVGEFLALEVGPVMNMAALAAGLLMADVLNCRDRHPLLWDAVMAGEVRFWQARQVVQAVTLAGLDVAAAHQLDSALASAITRLGWTRARRLLRGLIVAADPASAANREREAAKARFVHRTGSADGIATIVARVKQADALFFDATLSRIAEILADRDGNPDRDVRRSEAFAIMATPARALALLQSAASSGPSPDEQPAGLRSSVDDLDSRGPRGCAGHVCGTITVDPERLLPRTTLVVHISDESLLSGRGVARAEKLGPVPVKRLRRLLGNSRITVRPVFDPSGVVPVDNYEIPSRMRAAVVLRDPHEVFPFGTRSATGLDLDHTTPYRWDADAPPGQTRTDNLGPFTRRVHRAKTQGRWQVVQPAPGFFAWTSPAGFQYLVGPHGTIAEPRSGAA